MSRGGGLRVLEHPLAQAVSYIIVASGSGPASPGFSKGDPCITQLKSSVQYRARLLKPPDSLAKKGGVASQGCGHSIRARRLGLNRARNPSSSIRYVADSSNWIRIDFEGRL